MSNFYNIYNLKETNSYKWNTRYTVFGSDDIIPMSIADMDLKTSPEIIDSLLKRVNNGIFGYPIRPQEYYDAFKEWMKKKHNYIVHKNDLVDIMTIVPAINLSIQEFSNINDEIVILTPVYTPFIDAIKTNQRKAIECPLILKNKKYFIDFETLEKIFIKGCKFFIFCSPHNPVGRVWKKEELEKIALLVKKYDVFMISDEIHMDITYFSNKHIPSLSIENLKDNCICFTSPGKTFNIAGLHSAISIIKNDTLKERFNYAMSKLNCMFANTFSITAFTAAYRDSMDWHLNNLKFLQENRNIIIDFFEKNIPKISIIDSEGTFLLWLDCRKLEVEESVIFDFFAKEAKVGLSKGSTFGKCGLGFMRMNIGYPRPIIDEVLKRIKITYDKRFK